MLAIAGAPPWPPPMPADDDRTTTTSHVWAARLEKRRRRGTVSVQHVVKASSDKLMRKFTDPDAHAKQITPPRRSLALRRKQSSSKVALGLSARDLELGAELVAPKRRRSIGGST
uniref:Uncharacterized protein n=1 Tax=Oryza nivara TaxID=4536 RepID=A0A0E0J5L7_ORYNI